MPMSDHADFEDLLAHAALVEPQRVVAMHGFAEDFARILRARGTAAGALEETGERPAEDA